MGMLFEDKPRDFMGPGDGNESTWSWLDRSGSSDATVARARLEELYARYPDPYGKLLSRILAPSRRDADNAFDAAVAELVLFDRLTVLGFSITTDEEISGHEARPDFQLTDPDGTDLVIEIATQCMKASWAEREWRTNTLVDAIDAAGFRSDYYLLGVQVDGEPPEKWPMRLILTSISDRLRALPERCLPEGVPTVVSTLSLRLDRCQVEIEFYGGSSPIEHGDDHRIVGVPPGQGGCPNTEGRVRRTLRSKHPRRYPAEYELSGKPYVICLAMAEPFATRRSLVRGLYGDETLVVKRHGPEAGVLTNAGNGYFGVGKKGPRNTLVGGVLVADRMRLEPFQPGSATYAYFANPFALHPYDGLRLGAQSVFGTTAEDDEGVTLGWTQPQECEGRAG